MSEDVEIWQSTKDAAKEKKIENLINSLRILKENRISFMELTAYQYRVYDYDFWPSTGKFYNQKTKDAGRGVFNLIKIIKKKEMRYGDK